MYDKHCVDLPLLNLFPPSLGLVLEPQSLSSNQLSSALSVFAFLHRAPSLPLPTTQQPTFPSWQLRAGLLYSHPEKARMKLRLSTAPRSDLIRCTLCHTLAHKFCI